MDIHDKVVVVTGAGRGLGRKMAEMIAAKGGRLALAGISEEGLRETAGLCTKAGGNARHYITDVSDEAAVEKMFRDVVRGTSAVWMR